MRYLLWFFVLVAGSALAAGAGYMDTVYRWKYVDYLWDSEAQRQEAIQSGGYDFSKILPMDVDKSADGRIFLSILGMTGVPATLVTVTDRMGPSGPLVKPYPDWSFFRKGDCDSITNVYRIAIDKCNRLWVLDTGFLEGQTINCEAQLLAFDLSTDQLITRIKIPNEIARDKEGKTLLANPIVETTGPNCEQTAVFMAETFGFGLVVWSEGRLFRLEGSVYAPQPNASHFVVGNHSMELNGGVVGMALSPKIFPNELRLLYFRPLASFDLYAAPTEVLKRSVYGNSIRYLGVQRVLSSQALGMAFGSDGTLFLGMSREMGIACWNRYLDLNSNNIELVAQDDQRLQYPNGVKVIPPSRLGEEEELWVLTNRFMGFQLGRLGIDDYNFHVLKSPVKRLQQGTRCQIPFDTPARLQETGANNQLHVFSD